MAGGCWGAILGSTTRRFGAWGSGSKSLAAMRPIPAVQQDRSPCRLRSVVLGCLLQILRLELSQDSDPGS